MSVFNRFCNATKRTVKKVSDKAEELFDSTATLIKIKNLEGYMSEEDKTMSICFGTAEPTHRYFLLKGDSRSVLFGYDSENHKPSPVFMAELD